MGTYRYLAHQDANWDWKTFNIDTDPALAKKKGGIIDAVETDMSKFKAHGGKLLLYHGWADPAIQPEHTVIYYNSVLAKMGKNQNNWMQLFMVPGMGHCSGGAGPNQIDWMGALENWREKGQTPASIIGKGTERRNADDTADVPASSGRHLQGQRRHQRRCEFRLQVSGSGDADRISRMKSIRVNRRQSLV